VSPTASIAASTTGPRSLRGLETLPEIEVFRHFEFALHGVAMTEIMGVIGHRQNQHHPRREARSWPESAAEQTGQHSEQGGLARAIGAGDHQRLAARKGKSDIRRTARCRRAVPPVWWQLPASAAPVSCFAGQIKTGTRIQKKRPESRPKKHRNGPLVDLARSYEIIYNARNHASGRREFNLAPNMMPSTGRHGRTAEMTVPASFPTRSACKVFALKVG
jgi:hypothetical protein